ncbi:interactor of HORMAD1 protein 1 isoform X1 [Pongo pygmaeus]|uniref:interactor of HORMAD1 protein 1 isoform X1 n=1 Tax=Pongo pygmaeus TaxID=9600 RepID=UPI0023E2B517|nr:interactor of HORMAD1 protein 1 isoform X1 [Pongo pygmaeus]XP_054337673.1 interactor of HORMAD1 protein 1 isoform X1 [Pongo pygmaeus]XP_054337674.1 interactor of HORMAD1 protein 1 isoform X1 [Pongo pygmaeus]XP_054337676.1 interactor of HORMAD1 protein 1 isoform X1 [Pongo pygmaeus]XP_054337677.1 interactor of HORMAD1 protein 1 isoform X1 [Pongo pygmaeus]XP_054337678.1 interactor of HORMAD1 protein 1 isoform X1 [Pongo pygmaeus]XP_054337679.1 interactor of HORMAD1 protein 1 isoform X1 [Pongo 
MNFNVWNIKEMLSIPSGSGNKKSSNWNNNQNDYSSLSDSQFLFGSQFCPENSETLSAPLDFGAHLRHSKQSQQNSLEGEPSIFTKYQTKPQLFGGDIKDGGLFPPPLSVGKSKGLLEQFEEKKKRAKDKYDSETLYNFVSNVRESIHRLQTSVEKSEEHLSSRSQSILDSLETVAKTLQETVQAQNDLVFEAVQDKANMQQAILEMKKRFEARQAEFIEMKSNLKHLEVLVAQQSKEFQQLCEQLGQLNVPNVLAELKRLISVPPVKDSASQTSPPLAQSLNLTRQEKYTSEKPVLWQAQALPAAWNPGMGSLQPGEFVVWGEGAKNDALQEEAALPAFGSHERNRQVKDKAVQTNFKNWAVTKTGAKNHGSSIPGHKIPSDRDLVSQGASQLTSLEINNFSTSIKNACQKYQAQSMFLCDPREHLVIKQKDGTVEMRGKDKKQQPRKAHRAHRGRLLASKQKQIPIQTCKFNSKYQSPQPAISVPQSPFLGQQEPHAQPLHLQCPRSPKKSVCPILGGTVMPNKTVRAEQGRLLQLSRCASQDNRLLSSSSQGDHQMSWFSDLNLGCSETPLCKEAGKNLLYDLGFDSSDDDGF